MTADAAASVASPVIGRAGSERRERTFGRMSRVGRRRRQTSRARIVLAALVGSPGFVRAGQKDQRKNASAEDEHRGLEHILLAVGEDALVCFCVVLDHGTPHTTLGFVIPQLG